MTHRLQILFFILIGIFASCKTKNKVGTLPLLTANEHKSTVGFDSLLEVLFSKYPYGKEFKPFDDRPLNQLYHLEKRIYIPDYHGITFERRLYLYSSVDYINFINIYNDSFQFVLPLTDLYYLDLESNKFFNNSKYAGSSFENLNFGKELTSLSSKLNMKDRSYWKEFLDIIMSFFDAKCMNNRVEYEKYQIEVKSLIQDKQRWGISKKCLVDLNANKKTLPFEDKNKLIYYNGVVVYIFTIYPERIEVEYLNSNCFVQPW